MMTAGLNDALSKRMRQRRGPPLLYLLEAIASGRGDLSLDSFDAVPVAWALESGLGPLFFRAVKERPDNSAFPYWGSLKAADLTARIVAGDQVEAMGEIIDACRRNAPPLTLLKGISVSEEWYPESHLRSMRDLDFLVAKEALPAVEATLKALGYRQPCPDPAQRYGNHHHAAPFFHPGQNVWVEVHHGLFSPHKRASRAPVFSPENVLAQRRRSQFHGREAYRLSAELQLVYLAAHWGQDFTRLGGMIALVDAIFLLHRAGGDLRWDRILHWIQGSVAATYLFLLLSYMDRRHLIKMAPEMMRELFLAQPTFGRVSLKAAHLLIDRFFVTGKSFGPVLSERNVSIVWKTLLLPGPSSRNLMLAPLNLSLPFHCRIQ
ncbi:MAG: nucleotidyltransferase family protein [Candidatus Binatia bacterium]